MQRIILAITALVMTLNISGLNVNKCHPGQLSTLIDDCNITSLEVSGRMDARDFRFIADSLRHLTTLDLSQAVVDAYSGETLFANVSDYAAHELPCLSLASMRQLQQLALPDSLTRLGDGSLSDCRQLVELTLPPRVERIGDYALSGCSQLKKLFVPQSLVSMGDGALSNCAMLEAVVMLPSTDGGTAQAASLRIGYRAFANCPSLKQVALGNHWSEIGAEALAETGLEQLDMSNQTMLDSLASWSLANSQLTRLVLPAAVRSIGDGAMMNDRGINQLTLPANVKHIGSHAMAYMTGLKQIESKPTEVPQLGDSVWYGVDQSKVLLKVSPQSLADYSNTPQWCNFMTMELPRGDVNADGQVDIADVNIVINIMLGKDDADNYDGRAYLTDDMEVDIADVNAVINLMLGRQRALRLAAEKAAREAAAHTNNSATGHPAVLQQAIAP